MINEFLSTRKNSIVPCLFFLLFFLSVFLPNSSRAALMVPYERLQPVTSSLTGAIDMATGRSGRLYVADAASDSITVFDEDGSNVATLSGLAHPLCVAIAADDKLYVGNKETAEVEVYTSNLSLQHKLGLENSGQEFIRPNDLGISSAGLIYVVDWGADRVKVYNPNGTFAFSFGKSGSGNGEFHRPLSIAIDETTAELVVLDQKLTLSHDKWIDGARIQVFDMNGVFKRGVTLFGKSYGDLFRPQRLTIDEQGRWYVTDSYHNVVFVYDGRTGTFLGTIYSLQNPLRTPVGIIHGQNNRLYIAARGSGVVEQYRVDEALLAGQGVSMAVSPLTFIFQGQELGDNPEMQSIRFTNMDAAPLGWSAVVNDSWITMSSLTGSVSGGTTASPSLGVNLNGLAAGTYLGSVEINTGVATTTVNVKLIVTSAPRLSVTPSALTFTSTDGSVPSDRIISIANIGSGTLNWSGTVDQSWIRIDKTSGTAPDGITVGVDISSLVAGEYLGAITVNGDGALSSPLHVGVTLTIVQSASVNEIAPLSASAAEQQPAADTTNTDTINTKDETEFPWDLFRHLFIPQQ